MNIALYLLFTVCCFYTARPPRFLCALLNPYLQHPRLPAAVRRVVGLKRMGRRQTVAVCFCGAAKTTSLGIPLVTAMWKDADDLTRAFIQIPVLLYTIEQVCLNFLSERRARLSICLGPCFLFFLLPGLNLGDDHVLTDAAGICGKSAGVFLQMVSKEGGQGGV